jgi:hypothetical protein
MQYQKILPLLPILGGKENNLSTWVGEVVSLPGYGSFSGTVVTQTLSGYELDQPVASWLGIEYAAQPIGNERFAAPSYPLEFEGVKTATEYGKVCPQEEKWFSYPDKVTMGEDCLYMNIFRPEGVPMEEKLPLLVWIHGVGFPVPATRTQLKVLLRVALYLGQLGTSMEPHL